MKRIILTLLITAGLPLSAQIGINTPEPKAGLDVNGDLDLRGKIAVFNVMDNKLSEGTHDQVLVSQGEGYPPAWKTLRIPEYEPNKFYLIYNNSFSDRMGLNLPVLRNLILSQDLQRLQKTAATAALTVLKNIRAFSDLQCIQYRKQDLFSV